MNRIIIGALAVALALGIAIPWAWAQGARTANIEVRVWERGDSRYISARPEGGSWGTLGTIPLDFEGETDSGWRYADIALSVPVERPVEPPAATPTPSPTATPTPSVVCDMDESIALARSATAVVRGSDGGWGTAFHIGGGRWVTNAHVVGYDEEFELELGGKRYRAQLAWKHPSGGLRFNRASLRYDYAYLETVEADIPALALETERVTNRTKRSLRAGGVALVGYPVSSRGKPELRDAPAAFIRYDDGLIEYRVKVGFGRGASGGPVIDECGTVHAVNTASIGGGHKGGVAAYQMVRQP